MSTNWIKLEKDVFHWLEKGYGEQFSFELKGKSDPTISDIKVTNKLNNKSFYIEVKSLNSQCGQFVVLFDKKTNLFTWSQNNKSTNNSYSKKIIKFMNKNSELFKNASTKETTIAIKNRISFKWVKKYYSDKGVKLFASKYNSTFILIPLKDINKYFYITAVYRIKKSGSHSVPIRDFDKIINAFNEYKFLKENNKLYILVKQKINEAIINNNNKNLYLSDFNNDHTNSKNSYLKYEARILSNTKNYSVIFKLKLNAKIIKSKDKNEISKLLMNASK